MKKLLLMACFSLVLVNNTFAAKEVLEGVTPTSTPVAPVAPTNEEVAAKKLAEDRKTLYGDLRSDGSPRTQHEKDVQEADLKAGRSLDYLMLNMGDHASRSMLD